VKLLNQLITGTAKLTDHFVSKTTSNLIPKSLSSVCNMQYLRQHTL